MPELICRLQRVSGVPDVAVVALNGSIDPRNLSTLETALSSARGSGFRTVVLDLEGIKYINSAGLAFLVNLSDALEARGGGLLLANPQPKVKIVFDMMGVSEFFKLYKSVDTALRRFKRAEPVQSFTKP